MKKKIILLLLFFIFIFGISSCGIEENPTPTPDPIQEQLKKPVLTLSSDKIEWEKVENATKYIININGVDRANITNTYYELSNFDEDGEYIVKVQAVDIENKTSDYSDELKVTIDRRKALNTPVLTVSDNNLEVSWKIVDLATGYIININGEDKEPLSTTQRKYQIPTDHSGTYEIKVKAITTLKNYKDSEYSDIVKLTFKYETQLESPIVKNTGGMIEWEAIENASKYIVSVNNEEIVTTDTKYILPKESKEEYNIIVFAASDDKRYEKSVASNIITYIPTQMGYLSGNDIDFSIYENTSAYVQVRTADEFLTALKNAQLSYETTLTSIKNNGYVEVENAHKYEGNWKTLLSNGLFIKNSDGTFTKIPADTKFSNPNYTNEMEYYKVGYVVRNNTRKNEGNWQNALNKGLFLKNSDGTFTKIPVDTPFTDPNYTASMTYYEESPYIKVEYTQQLISPGSVHVIEIMNDLELGWNKLSEAAKATNMVQNFTKASSETAYTMSSMFKEYGMSQILVQRINDLLIYSKNGSKITHGGFKVNYCKNVVFRNIEMDEMWQWEDSKLSTTAKVGDMDAFGWAYFKIGYSDDIWIDHCTFGKSYDGQIDIANTTQDTLGTYKYAPYGSDNTSNVHISWCNFKAGSDDPNGYLMKMMAEIEADYQAGNNNYLYYKALRDAGITKEQIIYGIAIPQKKAFLCGDTGNGNDDLTYNYNLTLSIDNCYFKNIEDRLPKVRGGNAYVTNSIFDNSEYYTYRTELKTANVASKVSNINSSWKCALVSQGFVVGCDGSIYSENCIFKGIYSLLKNNDGIGNGGAKLINCSYQVEPTDSVYIGSSFDENEQFSKNGSLDYDEFFFRTNDNKAPFVQKIISLDNLESNLLNSKYKVGINTTYEEGYLLKSYK